jgi:membrane-associated phospholipid phosphatase
MVLERLGLPTTLELHFKGDLKRESRWLAQYGQSVCTPVAALLVWQLDPMHGWQRPVTIVCAVLATSIACTLIKRSLGRVRPGREKAGQFLGPSFRHANFRESFPSSHSACAIALTTALVYVYPQAAATLWGLAIICALLRYLLDAHWPSDILAGAAMGYVIAFEIVEALPPHLYH